MSVLNACVPLWAHILVCVSAVVVMLRMARRCDYYRKAGEEYLRHNQQLVETNHRLLGRPTSRDNKDLHDMIARTFDDPEKP